MKKILCMLALGIAILILWIASIFFSLSEVTQEFNWGDPSVNQEDIVQSRIDSAYEESAEVTFFER